MRVSVLHLGNLSLGGTLGPSLGNLTFLRSLYLSKLNLHGEIPREVSRLKRLQILDLSYNNIGAEIPVELINCSNLEAVNLNDNKLSGKVPSWFGSMMQLTQLFLGANNLVGTIPPSLGNLTSLEKLSFGRNHLEGSIPHVLGRLLNLKELYLSENYLTGMVPYSLYNLSNVQILSLSINELIGTLPSNMHLVFPNVQVFLVGGNQFTGTFPFSISNLTELRLFDITANGFIGAVPPILGRLNKLQVFSIGSNGFGSGRAHDLDFLSSLTNCTQLQKIILDGNRFGGVLPDRVSNLSTHLSSFRMQANLISGSIPEGIGQLSNLSFLNLGDNSLEGTIPDSIGKLKSLVILVLQGNKLSGYIPTTIGNLSELSELYLGGNKLEGTIPITLGYCNKLLKFAAYENNLTGNIPDQVFGLLEGLVYLHLYNNFLTGPIPSEFGNLKNLFLLDLRNNSLSGEIPSELAACIDLADLRVTGNMFHGSIPHFLGSLRFLQILDLSNNNFSSTIPHELQNLSLLIGLDLSYNHLSGEVPVGGIFSNVTAFSIIGNEDLCGGVPQLGLPACSSFPSKEFKGSISKKFILIIVVVGGVLISIIVLVSIYCLKKKHTRSSSSPSLQNRRLRVTYGDLHLATNGFSSSNLVGTGSFGFVYIGTIVHFERPVAIKVLDLQTCGALKSFMAECEALGKIKHRNLLNILTCCSSVNYEGQDFKAIIFEFMPNGSLECLLYKNEKLESRNLNLNLKQRLSNALDVAHALHYLHHDSEQIVVHCDIKPSNVLLDDDMVAHLGDFGLARLLHEATSHSCRDHASSSTIKGTIGYVPPEYGAGGSVSPQGDIYSFGILLLEMLTGKKPTDSMFNEGLSLHKFCEMAIPQGITQIVDSILLNPSAGEQVNFIQQQNVEEITTECLASFVRIGVMCSAESPTHRRDIKDVIVELHAIKQKLSYL